MNGKTQQFFVRVTVSVLALTVLPRDGACARLRPTTTSCTRSTWRRRGRRRPPSHLDEQPDDATSAPVTSTTSSRSASSRASARPARPTPTSTRPATATVPLPGGRDAVRNTSRPSTRHQVQGLGRHHAHHRTDGHADRARRRGAAERRPGRRRRARDRHQRRPQVVVLTGVVRPHGHPARQRHRVVADRAAAHPLARQGPDEGQPVAGLAHSPAQQDLLSEFTMPHMFRSRLMRPAVRRRSCWPARRSRRSAPNRA